MTDLSQPQPGNLKPPDQAGKSIPENIQSPLGRDGDATELSLTQPGDALAEAPAPELPEAGDPSAAPESAPVDRPEAGTPEQQGDPDLSYMTSRKAELYDTLMNDPATRQAIEQTISLKLGEAPAPPTSGQQTRTPSDASDAPVTREEFDALQRRFQHVAIEYGKSKIAEARKANPDFESYEKDIGVILQSNPNLTLEQGYHLAKIQRNGGKPVVAKRPSPPPPTEAGPGGGGGRSDHDPDPLARVQQKIRSIPPGPNQTEEAIRVAFNAALESEGSEQ